jgi:hypothetical protein
MCTAIADVCRGEKSEARMPAIRPRDGNDDILIGRCEPRMIATLKASKLSTLFYIDAKSTGRSCFSFSVWRLAVLRGWISHFWIPPKLLFSLNSSVRCNATTNIWDRLLRYQWFVFTRFHNLLFVHCRSGQQHQEIEPPSLKQRAVIKSPRNKLR